MGRVLLLLRLLWHAKLSILRLLLLLLLLLLLIPHAHAHAH